MKLQSCMALMTAALSTLILVGCKPSTVANGRVTYEGQAVRKGSILFQPADGHGASCGGPIIDGRYQLEVTPGEKTVEIIGVKTVRYDRNDAAQAGLADAAAARGDTNGTYDCVDRTITAAEGNHSKIKVNPGSQTLDLDLKRPAGSTAGRK